MSVGKIKDIYPPGNNGTKHGAGRLTDNGTGKTHTFQTPGDVDPALIPLTSGMTVAFTLDGNQIGNVRAATPTCTLSASASNPAAGQPLVLSWTSENADTLTIDHGIGAVRPVASGSVTIQIPTSATTYTLTATNSSGNAVASVTVSPASGGGGIGGGDTGGGPA